MGKKKKPDIKPVKPSKIEPVQPDFIPTPEKSPPPLPPEADPIPREPEIKPNEEKEKDG